MQVLSTTPRRVLALAGAVGVITGAITGVLALLPKSPETLSAHFEGVTATPEVSLEQYDARAMPIGALRSASLELQPYRLAAYTTSSTATGGEEEDGHTGATGTTSTSTTRTGGSHSSESTSSQTSTTQTVKSTTSTTPTVKPTTSTTAPPTPPSQPTGRRVTRKGAKRHGGKIALGSSAQTYPQEKPAAPTLRAVAAPPPAPALHPVTGALVSEGAGVPHGSVAAVAALVGGEPAEPAPGASPPQASTHTTTEGATTSAPTESAAPAPSAAPARGAASAQPTHIVLPSRCSSRTCGATQEIERALTYDPNPVKAAEAVAAIFNDSRAEVVGRNLYPLGAEVSYNVTLKGFAHSTATIVWSLVGKADKRPLARPWWRDIVVAHVKPTVNEESLEGSFWVPMPPEHGNYLVKLALLDSSGVHHATSYSEPAFH
jgi:hypothetical protein